METRCSELLSRWRVGRGSSPHVGRPWALVPLCGPGSPGEVSGTPVTCLSGWEHLPDNNRQHSLSQIPSQRLLSLTFPAIDQKTFPFLKILTVNTYSCFRFVGYYLLCPWAFRGNILTRNPFSFSQCISFSQFSFLQLSWLKFLSFSGDKNMAFLNLCHWKYATIFKA